MDLEKLKEYIQHELVIIKSNKEDLIQTKEQLSLLRDKLDDMWINTDWDSFSNLFEQFEFNMTLDQVKEHIGLIDFFKQLNTANIPQYETTNNDLNNLKEQIERLILEIDKKTQEKINVLENALNILNKNDLEHIFNDEEINKLFDVIKILSVDIKEKFYLIRNLTNINLGKKLIKDAELVINNSVLVTQIERNKNVVTDLLNEIHEVVDEPIIDDVEQVEVIEEVFEDNIDTELLKKIQEIVNHLSQFYEVQQFEEITSETNILERKKIYSFNNKISKYNWPLIYTDLCEYLIPMYENGNNVDKINEIFEFIIDKYTIYESVCDEFDQDTIVKIENYLQKLKDIDRDEIELLFNQMKNFDEEEIEYTNLSELVNAKNKYTNIEIKISQRIIDLEFYYNEYKKDRAKEIKNRFSSDLANDITNIIDSKQEIIKLLAAIEQLEAQIKKDDEIDKQPGDIIDNEEDNSIVFIENNDTTSLVIFLDDVSSNDNILNVFNDFYNGRPLSTLRNIVNCIYFNHYSSKQYNIDRYSEKSPYRKLSDYDIYKSLEKNEMWRSDKGKIRCAYRAIHISEKNKKILQSYFPSFEDTVFIITGIYYKTGKEKGREYVRLTNSFVERYQEKINHYVEMLTNEMKTQEEVDEIVNLINKSYEVYNHMCSKIKKKEDKKAGSK